MKVLAVFCHPVPDSFGAGIRDFVTIALPDVRTIDLYSGADLPRDFADADGEALSWAEAVVLVYPTWWATLPAPLMGWVEDGLEQDRWRHLTRVVAITTHGSSRLVNLVTGGIGRRIVRRGLPKMMAANAQGRFIGLYSMDTIGDEERTKFLDSLPLALHRALN